MLKACLIYLSLDSSSLSIVGPVAPLKYYLTVLFERCYFHFCLFYSFFHILMHTKHKKSIILFLFQICTILKRPQGTQHAQCQRFELTAKSLSETCGLTWQNQMKWIVVTVKSRSLRGHIIIYDYYQHILSLHDSSPLWFREKICRSVVPPTYRPPNSKISLRS